MVRVLIKRVRAGTECAIGEEQCGFRQGRGCMDQVFTIRQVCQKYLANGKDVFRAFMDLEKALVFFLIFFLLSLLLFFFFVVF